MRSSVGPIVYDTIISDPHIMKLSQFNHFTTICLNLVLVSIIYINI